MLYFTHFSSGPKFIHSSFVLYEFGVEFLCSKYKISEDVSLLLQSSKAIGRVSKFLSLLK